MLGEVPSIFFNSGTRELKLEEKSINFITHPVEGDGLSLYLPSQKNRGNGRKE